MFKIEQFVGAKKVGAPHTGNRAGSAKTLEPNGDALRRAERLVGDFQSPPDPEAECKRAVGDAGAGALYGCAHSPVRPG